MEKERPSSDYYFFKVIERYNGCLSDFIIFHTFIGDFVWERREDERWEWRGIQ